MDAKLQEVLLDYGLEGYGLYWYCLELIASSVTPDNLTFELEHDSRVIARNTGSTTQRVEEMMKSFIELGLFEGNNGHITCLKMAKITDDYTSKLKINTSKKNVHSLKYKKHASSKKNVQASQVTEINKEKKNRTKSAKRPLNKKKNRIKEEKDIICFLNQIAGKNFRTTESNLRFVRARINQGYSGKEIKEVVKAKTAEWDKSAMAKYLRPSTLFNDEKFNQYFGELGAKSYEKNIRSSAEPDFDNAEISLPAGYAEAKQAGVI